jgi:hypothetical protein
LRLSVAGCQPLIPIGAEKAVQLPRIAHGGLEELADEVVREAVEALRAVAKATVARARLPKAAAGLVDGKLTGLSC